MNILSPEALTHQGSDFRSTLLDLPNNILITSGNNRSAFILSWLGVKLFMLIYLLNLLYNCKRISDEKKPRLRELQSYSEWH